MKPFITFTSARHLVTMFTVTLGINGRPVKRPVPLSVISGVFYAFFFLCTIPLYIHIYIVVKKSSIQMGVKREGVLARKLALLVFTNLVFSVIPLSLTPVISSAAVFTLDFFTPALRTYRFIQNLHDLFCLVTSPPPVPEFLPQSTPLCVSDTPTSRRSSTKMLSNFSNA